MQPDIQKYINKIDGEVGVIRDKNEIAQKKIDYNTYKIGAILDISQQLDHLKTVPLTGKIIVQKNIRDTNTATQCDAYKELVDSMSKYNNFNLSYVNTGDKCTIIAKN